VAESLEPTTNSLDPLWYRDAVIYQVHVRSFADGSGDGIGDFAGLTARLDHIQDLGATAVWILPFYPSPMRDGGYDIADYTGVNPEYGSMRDFRRFVNEAHNRDLRVITEVVINHTSDQHKWFQRARRAKLGSKFRDFYMWSETDDKYADARIIFSDFESSNWSWDSVAGAYYWHRFYSHQPDLNFDNPAVHDAVIKVVDYWLSLGVDGLRLDAIPYLYAREGTTCENLPETHAFLKKLRAHVDAQYEDRMLLAEANQWPEDTRAYFGDGDECHMAFNFPVMPRMYMALQMEDRYPLVDIFEQTPEIPESAQWALFLRNHDELTLEMVTDEERDYMYRVYASDQRARVNLGIRRRLAPLLNNDRRKIELLNGLLLSLPGTPIIYYGDEIGMGDNIYLGDRDGVRTPMQWSADRNAGFSVANPQQLFLPVNIDPEYRYESVNVSSQEENSNSLLVWMRRTIGLRQKHAELFGGGDLEFLKPDNSKVLCYLRHRGETVLVVANLSRFSQYVELDLAKYRGHTPMEMFGHSQFPSIGELPYLLTIGPYGFYWFVLEPSEHLANEDQDRLPVIPAPGNWPNLFDDRRMRKSLESVLPAVLRTRRWFGGKGRRLTAAIITDAIPVSLGSVREFARILLVEAHYNDGEPETYVMPVTYLPRQYAEEFLADHPGAGLVRIRSMESDALDGVLCDALADELFSTRLMDSITTRRKMRGPKGELRGVATKAMSNLSGGATDLWPSVSRGEQSNTSILFGDTFVMKLFRRSEIGLNPDWEIGRYLTEVDFDNSPRMAGALEYRDINGNSRTIAVLQELVAHDSDAWSHTLYQLGGYFEALPGVEPVQRRSLTSPGALVGLGQSTAPELAHEMFGTMLQEAELIGQRTAEMHLALMGKTKHPDFAVESFNAQHQRSMYQSIRNQTTRAIEHLKRSRASLGSGEQELADGLLARVPELHACVDALKVTRLAGPRMRIHGDFHLGQLLFTGRDFQIIDYEGEPTKPISVRRFKRSPLRDVAGLLRSFDYAAMSGLANYAEAFTLHRPEEQDLALNGARFWSGWVGGAFLNSYFETAEALFVQPPEDYKVQLRVLLLEKAAYELEYELNNRPDWIGLPISGLLGIID
jgi:maltose alpha-D-glucosyltransferase/alpha-amylase